MDILGFTSGDLTSLLIVAVVILVIIFILKFVLKMAFSVVKIGCFGGVLIFVAIALLLWLI
jgi:hypothetical protein